MIGRKKERNKLNNLLKSTESELVAIIGRRRVGKTFLIRQTYKKDIVFELTGIQNANMPEQLNNFDFALKEYFPKTKRQMTSPESWIQAFKLLIEQLSQIKKKKNKVIFIDELPWLATARSGFLKGFSFFWNSWASKQKIVVVICGSAASWMINKVILNKGGLHNRVTAQISLQPFTLRETKEYLKSQGVILDNYQIAQLYMTIGGIPYYLKQVNKGKSIPQIISSLFFESNATLRNEFDNLYQSLFNYHQKYVAIIEACYSKWKGITHSELNKITGYPSGGGLSKMVKELEVSGFLVLSQPYGNKKKETLIRLVDEFSIFHLKFINNLRITNWQSVSRSQSYKTWLGFAFENLCIKHTTAIKNKLGISGVHTYEYSLRQTGNDKTKGTQIDLIIDRADEVINLCEAKFYNATFTISKSYVEDLKHKVEILRKKMPQHKVIHLTMITTYGIKENKYSDMINFGLVLDDLF